MQNKKKAPDVLKNQTLKVANFKNILLLQHE